MQVWFLMSKNDGEERTDFQPAVLQPELCSKGCGPHASGVLRIDLPTRSKVKDTRWAFYFLQLLWVCRAWRLQKLIANKTVFLIPWLSWEPLFHQFSVHLDEEKWDCVHHFIPKGQADHLAQCSFSVTVGRMHKYVRKWGKRGLNEWVNRWDNGWMNKFASKRKPRHSFELFLQLQVDLWKAIHHPCPVSPGTKIQWRIMISWLSACRWQLWKEKN